MKLKDYSKEDLETMSYSEITNVILAEKGSKMKIVDIFKQICSKLELSDQQFENQIADFFQLISTDKDFIVLDKGFCDLKTRHNNKIVIEEEEDNIEIDAESEELNEEETDTVEEDEEIFYDNIDDDDDIEDADDLEDFDVIEDDEASM